jgi:hypothetical protein
VQKFGAKDSDSQPEQEEEEGGGTRNNISTQYFIVYAIG